MNIKWKQLRKALRWGFITCVLTLAVSLGTIHITKWYGGLGDLLDYCFDEYGDVLTWIMMIATPLFLLIFPTVMFYNRFEEKATSEEGKGADQPV